MRSDNTSDRQTAYLDRKSSSSIGSPPRNDIWSTERRLAEKPAPGAPIKSKRPYLPDLSPFQTSMERTLTDRALILPSKTIDEDDEGMAVSLPFRPTRLTFSFSEEAGTDPTTVLLGPSSPTGGGILSWHEDEEIAAMMDVDNDMSPRLFHRYRNDDTLVRYESIEIAEDESDAIFRSDTLEDKEAPSIQERFTSSPLQRCKDDVRI